MKKIISSMMIFTLVVGLYLMAPSTALEVKASEAVAEDGTLLTDEDESSVIVYPRMRGVYLLKGTCSITCPGNGLAGAYGSTAANFAVSKIYIGIKLEKYDDGDWYGVATATNTEYNDDYVSIYKLYSVTGGAYYRVTSEHWAASDWTAAATDGIWIAK